MNTHLKPLLSIDDVAEWLLSKQKMTGKKLNILLYYEYAWSLVMLNTDADHLKYALFNANWIAGIRCPVNPYIHKLLHNQWNTPVTHYKGRAINYKNLQKVLKHNRYVHANKIPMIETVLRDSHLSKADRIHKVIRLIHKWNNFEHKHPDQI